MRLLTHGSIKVNPLLNEAPGNDIQYFRMIIMGKAKYSIKF